MAVFMSGFRQTMRFIMILSGLEILVVMAFTVYVGLFFRSPSIDYAPASNVIGALPFGILAFAGIGSSIFLSENTRSWRRTVNRSILYHSGHGMPESIQVSQCKIECTGHCNNHHDHAQYVTRHAKALEYA